MRSQIIIVFTLSVLAAASFSMPAGADTYSPFCEAPIAQCVSHDMSPNHPSPGRQLYSHSRCHGLLGELTRRFTLVSRHVTTDPESVDNLARLIHEYAYFCPRPVTQETR